MENLIKDYFQIEFEEANSSYFGYLEKDELVIFIFIKDNNENNINQISKIIVEKIVEDFLEFSEYSESYIKNIMRIALEISELYKNKDVKNKNYKASILIILSNANSYILASIGDINFNHTKESNIKNELKLDSNIEYLGGDKIRINILGPITLEEADKLNVYDNEKYINSTIKSLKIKQITANFVNKSVYKIILSIFIFLFFIIYIIFNFNMINKYDKKIKKINTNIENYISLLEVQNINSEILKFEEIMTAINHNKILLLSHTKTKKYMQDEMYIKNLKQEIKLLEKYKKDFKIAKNSMEKDELNKALEIFKKLKDMKFNLINLSKYNQEIDENIFELNEMITVEALKKDADDYYNSLEYTKALKIYEKIYKIYLKYKKTNYNINEIGIKIEDCKNNIDIIKNDINNIIMSINVFIDKDYTKAIELLNEVIKKYERLEDDKSIALMNDKIAILNNAIELEKNRAISLRNEALVYAKSKNYKTALDCLIESNNLLKKTRLDNEILINKEYIRQFKSKLRENFESNKKRNFSSIKNNQDKASIIASINLSAKKGDEFMRVNNWDEAMIEYERAIDFSEKVDISSDKLDKLKKKLAYAIKKSNSRWWK